MFAKCEANISILKFFKLVNSLPTTEQIGLSEYGVCSANHVVERMLEKQNCQQGEDLSSTNEVHDDFYSRESCQGWQAHRRKWSHKSTETLQAIES